MNNKKKYIQKYKNGANLQNSKRQTFDEKPANQIQSMVRKSGFPSLSAVFVPAVHKNTHQNTQLRTRNTLVLTNSTHFRLG